MRRSFLCHGGSWAHMSLTTMDDALALVLVRLRAAGH